MHFVTDRGLTDSRKRICVYIEMTTRLVMRCESSLLNSSRLSRCKCLDSLEWNKMFKYEPYPVFQGHTQFYFLFLSPRVSVTLLWHNLQSRVTQETKRILITPSNS